MPTREIQDALGLVLSPGCEEYRSLEENLRQIAWLGAGRVESGGEGVEGRQIKAQSTWVGGRGLKMVQEMLAPLMMDMGVLHLLNPIYS